MYFPKLTITSAGRALLVRSLAGERMNFEGMAIGTGQAAEDVMGMTALENEKQRLAITQIKQGDGCAELIATFTNERAEAGFYARELGIFARCEGDEEAVLYAYANAGEESAYIPPYSQEAYVSVELHEVIAVGDAERVTATIGEFSGYAKKEDLQAHLDDEANPHHVTAAQVGLDKVQNAAPGEMTPAFAEKAEDAAVENIRSGQKLGVMLSAVQRAIGALKKHLAAENPHTDSAAVSVYDKSGAVQTAGGIAAFVNGKVNAAKSSVQSDVQAVSTEVVKLQDRADKTESTAAALQSTVNRMQYVVLKLEANGWTGTGPYRQTVKITGMTKNWESGVPVYVPQFNSDGSVNETETFRVLEQAAYIKLLESGNGTLTAVCPEEKPTDGIWLQVPGMVDSGLV